MLFAALIGPYLIDWTSYRAGFERQAAAAIGRPVTIAGKTTLRLLPTPVVTFTDVRIGDAEAPDVQIERFRAEVELAPLMKGEFRILQMTVERPRLRLDLATLADPAARARTWRIDPERISLARLEIAGGSATVEDSRSGRAWRADELSAIVEAGSLRGPARIDADFSLDGLPLSFRAALGRLGDDGLLPSKVTIRTPLYPATLTAEGNIAVNAGAALAYAGAATLAGDQPEDDEEPRTAWADLNATSAFELTAAALRLTESQVSYGALERPLIVNGSGRIDFGVQPRFEASVQARQIDVDQALGGGPDAPVSIGIAVAALAKALPGLPRPKIAGAVHLDAAGVVVGGGVIQAVGIDLLTDGADWQIENLAAMLPGETRLDVSGTLQIAGASTPPVDGSPAPDVQGSGFQGHGRIASQRPAAFAAWWRGAAGSAGSIGTFAVEADVDFRPGVQKLTAIAASVGDGAITGSVELHRFAQSGELFAAVTLSAERADLVQARALFELLAGDGVEAGKIDQLAVSLRADVLSVGDIEAHSVLLEGDLEGRDWRLRNLRVDDLAGASISAFGSVRDPFGAPQGKLSASVTAKDLTGAAAFLAGLAPKNAAIAYFGSVAPILSPVQADFSIEAATAGQPVVLDLNGSFAQTHLSVTARGEGSLGDLKTLKGRLTLDADGEDTATVLSQVGLDTLPVRAGPVLLHVELDGSLATAASVKASGTLAGIDLTYAGDASLRDGDLALAGDVTARSPDIDPALLMAGLALPGLGEGHAASVAGRLDGPVDDLRLSLNEASLGGQPMRGALEAGLGISGVRLAGTLDLPSLSLPVLAGMAVGGASELDAANTKWSDTTFASAIPPGLKIALEMTTPALDIGTPDAATDAKLNVQLADGALNIDLIESTFAGGKLQGAIGAKLAKGEAAVTLRAALTGAELHALVWERNGLPVASGAIDLSLDAAGAGRSMAGVVSSLAGSGSFAIRNGRLNALNAQALGDVMAAAEGAAEPTEDAARETFATRFGSGAFPFGAADGSFTLTQGVAKVATVSLESGAATVLADAALDLNAFTLTSDWSVRQGSGGDRVQPPAAQGMQASGGANDAQPYVDLTFTGPIADPERRVDLRPLLDLLRGRYLQRQLDELDRLEKARQQAEAERQMPARPLAPPRAPAKSPALTPDDLTPSPPTASELRREEPAVDIPSDPPLPAVEAFVAPARQTPLPDPPPIDLLRSLSPSFEDVLTGAANAADATAEPPTAAPEPPRTRPAPPPPRAAERDPPRREPRAAAPPAPAVPPQNRADIYKTLPNGVTIKVR